MRIVQSNRSRHGQRRRWHNPGPVLDIEAAVEEITKRLMSRLWHGPAVPTIYKEIGESDAMTEYIRERLVAHNATARATTDETLPTEDIPSETLITEPHGALTVPLAEKAREAVKSFNNIVRTHKQNRKAAVPSIITFFRNELFNVVMTAVSGYRIPPQSYDMVSYLVELVLNRNPYDALINFEKWGNSIAKFLTTCGKWPRLQGIEGNFVVVPQLTLPNKAIEMITDAVVHCEHTLRGTGTASSKLKPVDRMKELVYGPVLISYDVVPGAAAFYLISEDFIVIQSQARTLHVNMLTHAILHELGHRYWKLFASEECKKRWMVYYLLCLRSVQSRDRLKVGTVIYDQHYFRRGGEELLRIEGFDNSVRCRNVANNHLVTLPYEHAAVRTAFPTNYAVTNYEEHFCETFAIYLAGNLIEPFLTDFVDIWTTGVQ